MARDESDREDLLAEAVALVRRLEGKRFSDAPPFVAGFRSDGRFSLYLGADPVYHFLPDGRLYRAFVGGMLYRSQGQTLAQLSRKRTPTTTTLQRHDLTDSELQLFASAMQQRLAALLQEIEAGRICTLRQFPAHEAGLLSDVGQQLRQILQRITQRPPARSWLAPPFPGKK